MNLGSPNIKALLRLSIPMIIAQIIAIASTSFIGMLMIARLGSTALAAGVLISTIFAALFCTCLGMLFSIGVAVGHSFGKDDAAAVCDFARSGFILATILAIPVIIIFWNITPILILFGQSHDIVSLVSTYMKFSAFGILPIFWTATFNQFTLGISQPKFIIIWAITILVLNTFLGYVFIFGKFHFHAFGVGGFSLATTINAWFVFFVVIIGIFKTNKVYKPYQKLFIFKMISFRKISYLAKIGWPISVQFGGEIGIFAAMALLIGLLGKNALAAQQIVQQTLTIVTIIPFCFAQATAVLVGQSCGKNDIEGIKNLTFSGIVFGALLMMVVAVIYLFFPDKIINLYINVNDPGNFNIIHIATALLSIAAFYQIFDSIRNISTGALRGAHDTRIPMQISLISLWLIAMPVGYILAFYFNLGASGIMFGLLSGVIIASILLVIRLYRFNLNNFKVSNLVNATDSLNSD